MKSSRHNLFIIHAYWKKCNVFHNYTDIIIIIISSSISIIFVTTTIQPPLPSSSSSSSLWPPHPSNHYHNYEYHRYRYHHHYISKRKHHQPNQPPLLIVLYYSVLSSFQLTLILFLSSIAPLSYKKWRDFNQGWRFTSVFRTPVLLSKVFKLKQQLLLSKRISSET